MVLEQICAYFGNPDVSSRAAVTEEKERRTARGRGREGDRESRASCQCLTEDRDGAGEGKRGEIACMRDAY
jgi:hypothetical protein